MKKIFEPIFFILFLLTVLTGCAGALHSAAAKGDVKTLKDMLDSGADVNDISIAATVWGTPLHFASNYCQTGAVKLLLEKGVDVNIAAGNVRYTALRFAANNGCNEVVKLLLDKGAEIDARDRFGDTPVMWAAARGQSATVKLLIERGADADTAIGRLTMQKDSAAVQIIELAAKSLHEAKTRIPANKESPAVAIKSDVDELPTLRIKPNKHAYAVVIGVEQYRQKLPKADFAVGDARLVSDYLTKVMGYPEENVITLLNDHASNVDLAKYFEKWLPNNVEAGSSVFIYFSGHGAPNPKTGDAYLVPYDGDPSFIAETGYSLRRMYDALDRLPAKKIVVALDSCFSGAGERSVLAEGARPLVMNLRTAAPLSKNMTVMAASSSDQISSTYRDKGHGLFTYFLLKGIKDEDVVKPDGSIKIDELFGYIKPRVESVARKQYNNEQSPQLMGATNK